jgi:hypothetical protein
MADTSRPNPFTAKGAGTPDEKSRQKAEAAHKRANDQIELADTEAWPRGVNGQPMMKVTMTAAELIPTGQYANVSVGPAQITCFIDQDRQIGPEERYFTEGEAATISQALNELAEIVESDVVAVQRNIVLEQLQAPS